MRLFIAEKPGMGNTIASLLPGPRQPRDGSGFAGELVSWCVGHVLKQVLPKDYDPKPKSWSFDTLPTVQPSADKVEQVKTIRGCWPAATRCQRATSGEKARASSTSCDHAGHHEARETPAAPVARRTHGRTSARARTTNVSMPATSASPTWRTGVLGRRFCGAGPNQ